MLFFRKLFGIWSVCDSSFINKQCFTDLNHKGHDRSTQLFVYSLGNSHSIRNNKQSLQGALSSLWPLVGPPHSVEVEVVLGCLSREGRVLCVTVLFGISPKLTIQQAGFRVTWWAIQCGLPDCHKWVLRFHMIFFCRYFPPDNGLISNKCIQTNYSWYLNNIGLNCGGPFIAINTCSVYGPQSGIWGYGGLYCFIQQTWTSPNFSNLGNSVTSLLWILRDNLSFGGVKSYI